jgi:hypothetical protein
MPLFPPPPTRPPTPAEPPALVSTVGRGDVLWDRPVFKAPPLQPKLAHMCSPAFAEELRRIGLTAR